MLFELIACFVVVSVWWVLRVPLANDIHDRLRWQILIALLKIADEVPCKILGWFGLMTSRTRIYWGRRVIHIARIVGFFLGEPSIIEDLDVRNMRFGGVKARVYRKTKELVAQKPRSCIIFMHGGGFCTMKVEDYDKLLCTLLHMTDIPVISISYGLSPENVFPSALDECEIVVEHYLKEWHTRFNFDPSRTILMGDSAGGNLTAALANRLKDRDDLPPIAAQVLIYPVLQTVDMCTPSHQQYHTTGCGILPPYRLIDAMLLYIGQGDHNEYVDVVLRNEHVTDKMRHDTNLCAITDYDKLPQSFRLLCSQSPHKSAFATCTTSKKLAKVMEPFLRNPDFNPLVHPDLARAPRAMVITCGHDILRDEGYWYVVRLRDAGVETEWKNYPQTLHGVLSMPMPSAQNMINDIATFCLSI